jgi:hypothetical protein
MAAIITEIIPTQNFELTARQIGEILTVELANQKTLQSLPENHEVFLERITSVDKTEEVVINVLFDSIAPSAKSQSDTQINAVYFIDIYASGKAKINELGDELVSFKLLKYVGLCRYILQSHKYQTLLFPPGCVGGKQVDSISMASQDNSQDANFSRMARLTFEVRLNESQDLWSGILLDNNISKVNLDETEKGYQYKLKP